MNNDTAYEIFTDSYIRCTSKADFIDCFYKRFLNASPEIKAKFENTNFEKQKKLLLASLSYMILAFSSKDLHRLLGNVAHMHCKSELNIEPHLYDIWLDSMVDTVQECDPNYSPTVETAWRLVMQPGIDFIIGCHDQ